MLSMLKGTRKRREPISAGRLVSVPQPKKGLKLAGFRLRPDQIAALRREALKRASAKEAGRPDASELVREILDAWIAKAKRS